MISIELVIIETRVELMHSESMSGDNQGLAAQVARMAPIPPEVANLICAEIQRVELPWIEEYGEYQSGGWWTVSLFNDSGDPAHVRIRDCAGTPTTLLDTMPRTRAFIEGLGLDIMWARLARLAANSFLWEHVDYGELDHSRRHRLHIPLATNSSAQLVIAGRSLNLTVGHIWRLTPANPHGVCNFYGPDRIHIIIDCYEDEALRRLLAAVQISDQEAPLLPQADGFVLSEELRGARQLLQLGFAESAERSLLRLFFKYRMPKGTPYDLIVDMYLSQGMEDAAMSWKRRKQILLGLP
jgi:hypothetical protein